MHSNTTTQQTQKHNASRNNTPRTKDHTKDPEGHLRCSFLRFDSRNPGDLLDTGAAACPRVGLLAFLLGTPELGVSF